MGAAQTLDLPVVCAEIELCLLDAFCEDEGFAFDKLDEIERRIGKAGALDRIDPATEG